MLLVPNSPLISDYCTATRKLFGVFVVVEKREVKLGLCFVDTKSREKTNSWQYGSSILMVNDVLEAHWRSWSTF